MLIKRLSEPSGGSEKYRQETGIALIVVLFCVALLAIVVVAFLSSARTEATAAREYAVSAQAQQLATSALNVAMGQVSEGADLKWASDPTKVAWASQPGMIRTYDDTGNPLKFYKLYSSDQMIIAGSSISTTSGLKDVLDKDRPTTWGSQPAIFTDLNDPAVRMVDGAATLYFPIVDPRAAANESPTVLINNVKRTVVPGFSFSPPSATFGAVRPKSVTDTDARLPMPVKWLYVLKDGSTHAATVSNGGLTATVAGASKANPIVGRVAFWTDDDCSKVNINTAAEGSYWDVPVALYRWEYANLDGNAPVNGEFQRFPGHPATTSLSAVFPALKSPYLETYNKNYEYYGTYFPYSLPPSSNPYAIPMAPAETKNDDFYSMTPRIRQGGSKEGTFDTILQDPLGGKPPSAIPVSGDRLYDSVDELLYTIYDPVTAKPDRSQRGFLSAQDLALRRFFLTANSRAPETNLYNQPRVAIWPFDNNATSNRSAVEQLMAFASTAGQGAGKKEFFFTRNTPNGALSPTLDFEDAPRGGRNMEIYRDLQRLTAQDIPGFGGNFAAKWPGAERDQVLTEIFDYIRGGLNLGTDLNPAKQSYTFLNPVQWGPQGYRGVVYPTVPAASDPGSGTRGFGRYVTLGEAAIVIGSEYVGPETDKDPIGGFPTNINLTTPPPSPLHDMDPTGRFSLTGRKDGAGALVTENDMWAAIILELFLPSPGMKTPDVNVAVRVDGLDTFAWKYNGPGGNPVTTAMWSVPPVPGPTPMAPPVPAIHRPDPSYLTPGSTNPAVGNLTFYAVANGDGDPGMGRGTTARIGASMLVAAKTGRTARSGTAYPWTNPQGLIAPNYGTGFSFISTPGNSDATIKVTITPMETPSSGPGNPSWAQHFTIKFPAFTMAVNPVPTLDQGEGGTPSPPWYDMERRAQGGPVGISSIQSVIAGRNPGGVSSDKDIVRSMVLRTGDNRVLAVQGTSDSGDVTKQATNDFAPHYLYNDPTFYAAHSLSMSSLAYYSGVGYAGHAQVGSLASDPNGLNPLTNATRTYSFVDQKYVAPKIPSGKSASMSGAFMGKPGDWDTGPGRIPDGAYINKPDEGFDSADKGHLSYLDGPRQFSGSIVTTPTFYSPSRQVASPVTFGSLPTGAARNLPWQTLLFCPNPAAGWATKTEHPGYGVPANGPPFTTPPDYLLLDLFWMPVTEPWAISDRFSTAGKINMNYRMFPFDYITRSTGMRAVFANTFITAIADPMVGDWVSPSPPPSGAYKASGVGLPSSNTSAFIRYPINPDATLLQFDEKFNGAGPDGRGPDIFRSPAQICDEFLVPGAPPGANVPSPFPSWSSSTIALKGTRTAPGPTAAGAYSTGSFWQDKRLTGDNMRERPYNSLYPRLTTRSNVYTVHVKAQAIQQTVTTLNTDPTVFTEGKDKVNGEYRVSYTIERYLDPNLTTYAAGTALGPYKLRVINQRTVDW